MAKLSRDKGKRFERQVAHIFRQWGYPARRTAQVDGGLAADVLVEDMPRLHVECKHHKRIGAMRFMDQAMRDKKTDARPIVFLREDHGDPHVLIHASFFMELLGEKLRR